MKGLLFTELLEMIEEEYGYNTANAVVLNAKLHSKGIYTSAKVYHRNEMAVLFEQLQRQTKLPFETLAKAFGRHLCKRVLISYPQQMPYFYRIFSSITKKGSLALFENFKDDNRTLTVVYDPAQKLTCVTEGIVQGYLEHLRHLNRVEETQTENGKRKFVLSLKS